MSQQLGNEVERQGKASKSATSRTAISFLYLLFLRRPGDETITGLATQHKNFWYIGWVLRTKAGSTLSQSHWVSVLSRINNMCVCLTPLSHTTCIKNSAILVWFSKWKISAFSVTKLTSELVYLDCIEYVCVPRMQQKLQGWQVSISALWIARLSAS